MTDKEKAKKYDEALERARKELNTCGSLDCDAARQIFRFFPQLRESEDERIRKEIIHYILYRAKGVSEKQEHEWITYLEKQKELFCKGIGYYFYDGEKTYFYGYLTPKDEDFPTTNKEVAEFLDNHKPVEVPEKYKTADWLFEKQKEPHYTKRNELFDKCVENCDPEVMKEVFDNVDKMLEPKIAFGDWGDKEKKEAIITCLKYMRFIKKITNQEYDDLMNWLDSNLVSKEWSEEDEVYLQDALWCVKQAAKVAKDENDMGACWSAENWLKSLRPSWKPSKEQIYSLCTVVKGYNECTVGSVGYHLKEMYEQLKKLI